MGSKFTATCRENWLDWYHAFLQVDYTFEETVDRAAVAANTRSAPINGSLYGEPQAAQAKVESCA